MSKPGQIIDDESLDNVIHQQIEDLDIFKNDGQQDFESQEAARQQECDR